MPKIFSHHHGWNWFLFDVFVLWVQHPSTSQQFSGLWLVVGGWATFLFSGWHEAPHESYCSFTGQKRHWWRTCIHVNTAVSSFFYSTQLLIKTHFQPWSYCCYEPRWILVKIDPSRLLQMSNPHLPWQQFSITYLRPALTWTCIRFYEARRENVSSVEFAPRRNNDQRWSWHSGLTDFTKTTRQTLFPPAVYMPMWTVFQLADLSVILFSVIRHQFYAFQVPVTPFVFKHPQWFIRGTHSRFLHKVFILNHGGDQVTLALPDKRDAESLATKGLTRAVLVWSDAANTSCFPAPNPL